MRHAHIARQDANNILDERFKDIEDKVTKAIEQAVADGRFKTVISFDVEMNQPAKDHIIGKLRENDYKAKLTSYRGEASLEVSW